MTPEYATTPTPARDILLSTLRVYNLADPLNVSIDVPTWADRATTDEPTPTPTPPAEPEPVLEPEPEPEPELEPIPSIFPLDTGNKGRLLTAAELDTLAKQIIMRPPK